MNGSAVADRSEPLRGGSTIPSWTMRADLGASYTVEMPVETWINLADHPRRRDTERHARKAEWEQFARMAQGPVLEMLRWVAAGQVGDQVWKVDGHTRALRWKNGSLRRPDSVLATVFRCESRQALYDLYSTYDHPAAAETLYDRVSGAFHQHGLQPKSERLRSATIGEALYIAWRGAARALDKGSDEDDVDVYNVVGVFASELALLDSVNPQNDTFQSGVVAAALLCLALDPQLIGYFDQVSKREGSKQRGMFDPVEALLHMVSEVKVRRGAWGRAQQQELCAAALTGAFAWKAGESHPHYWVREGLPPADIQEVVSQVRKHKRLGAS
jgi:hypothetical protein